MGYSKTTWADKNVQYPNRYIDELNNTKTFTPDPGTVTEPGTLVTASRMNNLEAGLEATHKGTHIYGASSAGSNSYAITFSTAFTAYTTGLVINLKADVTNTGAATLNVDGLGAKSIKKYTSAGKEALNPGDLVANAMSTLIYDGTDFLLLSPTENDRTFVEMWDIPGSFTYYVPKTGTYKIICIGGGGGGGGCSNNAGYYCGGGGGGGGYVTRKSVSLTKGSIYTVTIGGGGSAGTNATSGNGTNGGAGGASSFGALVTANGGGSGSGAQTTLGGAGGNGGSGGGGGGGAVNSTGAPGGSGGTGTYGAGGAGGNSSTTTGTAGTAGGNGTDTTALVTDDFKGAGTGGTGGTASTYSGGGGGGGGGYGGVAGNGLNAASGKGGNGGGGGGYGPNGAGGKGGYGGSTAPDAGKNGCVILYYGFDPGGTWT